MSNDNDGGKDSIKMMLEMMSEFNDRMVRMEQANLIQPSTSSSSNNIVPTPVVHRKSNHENYVFSQIVKYDGKNLKHWITSVKAAFKSCGYSHFLEGELDSTHPDFQLYQNCLGTISLTFVPEKFEIIEHCTSVYQIWKQMADVEKDTYATAVRKLSELINCAYRSGSLRTWFETLVAKFESIDSDWIKFSDKSRCIVVMFLLRANSKFEQLTDRIMMNQNGTMKDILNEFIEYDEKSKYQSIASNSGSNDHKELAKMASKKSSKSGIRCSFCLKPGHTCDECWIRQRIEKQKLNTSSSSSSSLSKNKLSSSTSNLKEKSSKSSSTKDKRMAKSLLQKSIVKSPDVWILDSGCTSHITINENCLIEPKINVIEFEIASGKTVKSVKTGDVMIEPKPNCKLILKDVAFGDFNSNLVSMVKLVEDGFKISVDNKQAKIFKQNISFTANLDENNLWIINSKPTNIIMNLWHKRLAHCGKNVLKRIKKVVPQIDLKYENCDDCAQNKSVASPHNHPMIYENVKPFEMLHIDLWESPVPSIQGSKYGMLIVDHCTRFTFGISIEFKSDAASKLIEFIDFNQKRLDRKVKTIRTDKGTEFVNSTLKTFCKQHGIVHETTVGYSPEQNGIVERMNRTVFETVRLLLNSACAPYQLWAETMSYAIYVINIWIRADEKTPYEKFYSKKPNYNHLRTFGCEAFHHITKLKRSSKFDKTSERLMFIGYTGSTTNYRLVNPNTFEIVITNNVKFNEDKMFFDWNNSSRNLSNESPRSNFDLVNSNCSDDDNDENEIENNDHDNESTSLSTTSQHENDEDLTSEYEAENDSESYSSIEPEENVGVRRSTRVNFGIPPVRYGYQCSDSSIEIPTTYDEAINSNNSDEWKQAISKEITQLRKYKVFENVSFDSSRKVIPTKWIFTRKRDGTFKARLVACGYSQKYGIDYDQIASPTPDSTLTNLILSYAKTFDYRTRQLDIRTAFLNASLDEELYVKTPPGFGDNGHLKLKKALYGLKQSPLQWYKTISSHLLSIGFQCCIADKCLFMKNNILLLVYVDDIILCGPDENQLTKIVKDLEKRFEVTDIGNLKDYLGIEIVDKGEHFELNQSKYIRKIMMEFNMINCKPTYVPMSSLYQQNDEEEVNENLPIRKLIGSLLYVANKTRPDIMFATNWLSRFLTKPTKSLFNAGKQILRYLSGTIDQCLIIGKMNQDLAVYTDSSFGQGATRHSTSGLIVTCGNTVLGWKSNKQRKITISSCESELTAIMDGYRCVRFIQQIMNFINYDVNINFLCDNQSVIHLINNQSSMKRSRYFDIELKKIIEVFATNKNYDIKFVNTKEQLADFLTKPLPRKALIDITKKLFVN